MVELENGVSSILGVPKGLWLENRKQPSPQGLSQNYTKSKIMALLKIVPEKSSLANQEASLVTKVALHSLIQNEVEGNPAIVVITQ